MYKSNFFVISILLLIFTLLFTVQSQGQEQTEIKKWIDNASVDTQEGAIFNYTYLMKMSFKKHGVAGFGQNFSRVYQAIVPERFTLTRTFRHPMILIEDSNRYISATDIYTSRERLVDEIIRAESTVEESVDKKNNVDGGYWTMRFTTGKRKIKIDILKLLDSCQFKDLQHEQVNGNSVITIDFTPKTDAVVEDELSYLSKIEGRIWIDETSNRIIRVEGFPIGSFEKSKNESLAEREDEAILLFTQIKVAEGVWFPNIARLDFKNHSEIFVPLRLEFGFSDYKKSNVEINNVKINEPRVQSSGASDMKKVVEPQPESEAKPQ